MQDKSCTTSPDSVTPESINEYQEELDEEPRSILLGLLAQLRKGMDLHRVTLPTFVLEPRSMCERITDFMSHSELIIEAALKSDPLERFLGVVRYYMSGWHVKPFKGVKKPYNPVLGEFFRCKWKYPNNTEAVYICEQVSHHPPMSAYCYASPQNNILITGDLRPKSKFLGNAAATMMGGSSSISFLNYVGEKYDITLPNMYAQNVLLGTMYMEIGDEVTIRCEKNDLVCKIEFKLKGYFGSINTVAGKVKRESTGEALATIGGTYTEQLHIKKKSTETKELFLDVIPLKIIPKIVTPELQQEEFESRKLWSKVTQGLIKRDIDFATERKTEIEDNQRKIGEIREKNEQDWKHRFFKLDGDIWKLKLENVPADPVEAFDTYSKFFYSSPETEEHKVFWNHDDCDSQESES